MSVASLRSWGSAPASVGGGWPAGWEAGALAPAPGRRRGRLAEGDVAEPDVGEPVEDVLRGRRARVARGEELPGRRHRHRKHLADVAPAEAVLEHRVGEPPALTFLARGGDPGHHPEVG